jgi:hypothetical protein
MDVVEARGHTKERPVTRDIVHKSRQKNEESQANISGLHKHFQIERGPPLSLGTAIHMATAAVRSHLFKDKGYVYVDTHESGTSSMYLCERFVLENFSAVLRIKAGRLEDFPKSSKLVRYPNINDCIETYVSQGSLVNHCHGPESKFRVALFIRFISVVWTSRSISSDFNGNLEGNYISQKSREYELFHWRVTNVPLGTSSRKDRRQNAVARLGTMQSRSERSGSRGSIPGSVRAQSGTLIVCLQALLLVPNRDANCVFVPLLPG